MIEPIGNRRFFRTAEIRLVNMPNAFACGWLVVLLAAGTCAAQQPPDRSARAAPLDIDDPATPLVPRHRRDEAGDDRVESLAHFAAARSHENRQEFAQALRRYERAWRFDPQGHAALREIIALAAGLSRYDEAIRYAQKLDKIDDDDFSTLRRIGIYAISQGDWDTARKLYGLMLAAKDRGKPTPPVLLLKMEIGRIDYIRGESKSSAENLAHVFDALARRKELGLDEAFVKTLLDDPAKTYRLAGESFLADGRYKRAAEMFINANEPAPDATRRTFDLARVDAAAGRSMTALKKLETILDRPAPDGDAQPYRLLVKLLTALNREGEIAERLEKLHAAQPANAPLADMLAEHYANLGKDDRAVSVLKKLAADAPSVETFGDLVRILHRNKQTGELLDVLGQYVTKAEAHDFDTLESAGKALLEDSETCTGLIETAQRIIAGEKKEIDTGTALAAAYVAVSQKNIGVARKFFEAALETRGADRGDILAAWSMQLLLADKNAEAIEVLRSAIEDPKLASSHAIYQFWLAGALDAEGKTAEALRAAEAAASLRKSSPLFAGRTASILFRAREFAKAKEQYQKLLKQFDDNHSTSDVRDAMRRTRLAISSICVEMGQLDEAEEWLEQVLDEFPDDVGAMNDLGYLWADRAKHLNRSLAMIRRAVDAEPENTAYRDSLGWVLFRLGRYDQAIAALKQAAEADDADGVIHEHLGDVYGAAGRTAEAARSYGRAATRFQADGRDEPLERLQKKIRDLAARKKKPARRSGAANPPG